MLTGGCLCGQVRYAYRGEVGPSIYCHCNDCRRITGSAFNVGVRFEHAQFTLTAGTTKGFTKQADSGNELTRHFCANCGSPLYSSAPRNRSFIYVKAGTVDDPTLIEPASQSWVTSKVKWADIDDSLPSYPKGNTRY